MKMEYAYLKYSIRSSDYYSLLRSRNDQVLACFDCICTSGCMSVSLVLVVEVECALVSTGARRRSLIQVGTLHVRWRVMVRVGLGESERTEAREGAGRWIESLKGLGRSCEDTDVVIHV